MGVLRRHDVETQYCRYDNRRAALDNVRANIDAGSPLIALVKYAPWQTATRNQFEWGHFVVITGYDESNIYMHDPLFGLWVKPAERGAHYAMSHDLFCAGWGGFPLTENPNWTCCVTRSATAVAPAIIQPTAAPPTAVPSTAPTGTPEEINRRIRALAAYRSAEPPDFNDAGQVQLWRDHLGDWGQTFATHVVQSGETFSGLSSRFYGSQSHWPAIKEYNDLRRDGLWVGETIRVPHLGQSGAHLTPALPSHTAGLGKSLDFDDLIDPDLAAWDYNELGRNTVGMGFVEE
jgi:hypothetical protein